MKENQEKFSWNCFTPLKSSKDRWNLNNVRGQNQSVNIAAQKNSFGDSIVDDKKIAEHFKLIFSNLCQLFGREYADAPIYKTGDAFAQ